MRVRREGRTGVSLVKDRLLREHQMNLNDLYRTQPYTNLGLVEDGEKRVQPLFLNFTEKRMDVVSKLRTKFTSLGSNYFASKEDDLNQNEYAT